MPTTPIPLTYPAAGVWGRRVPALLTARCSHLLPHPPRPSHPAAPRPRSRPAARPLVCDARAAPRRCVQACVRIRSCARGGGGDPGACVPTPTLRLIIPRYLGRSLRAREQARGTVRASALWGLRRRGGPPLFSFWGGGAGELARPAASCRAWEAR